MVKTSIALDEDVLAFLRERADAEHSSTSDKVREYVRFVQWIRETRPETYTEYLRHLQMAVA